MFTGDRRDAAASCVDELVEQLGFTRDGEVTAEDLLDLPPLRRKVRSPGTCPSPQVTSGRLVSFLVSYMFVYLSASPSTIGL